MHTSHIITHDTLQWTHRRGYLTLAVCVCVRVVRGSERDTKRDRGGNREKRGSGEEKWIKLRVHHLHSLDIRIRDKRRRWALKVKNKMNAFIAASIVCEQSCVILLLSAQAEKKKKGEGQPHREHWARLRSIILRCGKTWMNLNLVGGVGVVVVVVGGLSHIFLTTFSV